MLAKQYVASSSHKLEMAFFLRKFLSIHAFRFIKETLSCALYFVEIFELTALEIHMYM